MQIVQAIFGWGVLIALLVLLYLIWRSSEHRLEHIQKMEVTMFDVAKADAENARKSVEAVEAMVQANQALAESVRGLVASLQKDSSDAPQ